MVIDYKGTRFSFKEQKRKRHVKRVRLAILVLFALILYFFVSFLLDGGKIGGVQDLLLQGKVREAREAFARAEGGFFHPVAKAELKGLIRLFAGDLEGASLLLGEIKDDHGGLRFEEFLGYFADGALYRELKLYTGYLVKRGETLRYYRALYHSGLFDAAGSAAAIETFSAEEQELFKAQLPFLKRVNQEIKSGKVPCILGVNGNPLGYYDIAGRKVVSLAPGIGFGHFNEDLSKCLKYYSLTIDLTVQQVLHRIFSRHGYRGTFLLFNLEDTGITAAYSKPSRGQGTPAEVNRVFTQLYMPGSIIKVLTLFAYLSGSQPVMFPYDCKGTRPIGGQVFYDWFRHGEIKDYDEALAVSCNISFAEMGLTMGEKKLGAVLDAFYFNGPRRDLGELCIPSRMGTYNKSLSEEFRLAKLSVGLNEITISTYHSALTAAVIARSGSIYAPYLLKSRKNLMKLAYYEHPRGLLKVIEDNAAFVKVKNAMCRVVEDPCGTGRRSRVDTVRVSMKTGTTGSKTAGFNAVIFGYFPADKPRYAFAFRLEGVGKAELKGAYFLKEFLTAFLK